MSDDRNAIKLHIERIVKRHIPEEYLKKESIRQIIEIFNKNMEIDRNEIIVLAYLLGADIEETDVILESQGFKPLYVKNWDDAIWRFFIRKRTDLMSINSYMFQTEE